MLDAPVQHTHPNHGEQLKACVSIMRLRDRKSPYVMCRVRMLVHSSAEGSGGILAGMREHERSSAGMFVEKVLDVVNGRSKVDAPLRLSGLCVRSVKWYSVNR